LKTQQVEKVGVYRFEITNDGPFILSVLQDQIADTYNNDYCFVRMLLFKIYDGMGANEEDEMKNL
jgi:hypothetical protein